MIATYLNLTFSVLCVPEGYMMNPDVLNGKNPEDLHLTQSQRTGMALLIDRLKEITLKIEELDQKEEAVQGDSTSSRDQLRAFNISRTVYVNEQKGIEKKLSDLLLSPPPETESPPESPSNPSQSRSPSPSESPSSVSSGEREISHGSISMEKKDSDPSIKKDESEGTNMDGILEMVPVSKQKKERNQAASREQMDEPQIETKKPRFKFNVLSFKMCPVCDARVPANYRTCGRCGTKLQNFCPHCTAAVPSGVSFCGKCGKKIT